MTSVPVVAAALVSAGLVAIGRQSEHHSDNSVVAPAAVQASGTGSGTAQAHERDALAAWMTSVPTGQQDKARAIHELGLIKHGLSARALNLPELVIHAKAANTYAAAFVADVGREPAATADVRVLKASHQREAIVFAAATGDYLRGIQNRDVRTLTAGDAQLKKSFELAAETARHGDALYHRLGGAQAFGSRIDFNAFAQASKEAQQAAK